MDPMNETVLIEEGPEKQDGSSEMASAPTEGALALQTETAEGETVTREQRRSRRKREVRARTISVKRMTKRELEMGRLLYPDVEDVVKPKTRAE